MKSVNLKVAGLSRAGLSFFKMGEVISDGLGVDIKKMEMITDDTALVMGLTDNSSFESSGSYSYVGPDGMTYVVTYVADEGGYRPGGGLPPLPKYD